MPGRTPSEKHLTDERTTLPVLHQTAHHVRRQLAFDLWWLALAVFVICIVEVSHSTGATGVVGGRLCADVNSALPSFYPPPPLVHQKSKIQDPNTNNYFNVFTVLFEVVSAYGCVGLSLGVPFVSCSVQWPCTLMCLSVQWLMQTHSFARRFCLAATHSHGRHSSLPHKRPLSGQLFPLRRLPYPLQARPDCRHPTRPSSRSSSCYRVGSQTGSAGAGLPGRPYLSDVVCPT